MTYCKDCRTEFMVEADDPCPRCGRYLGGARMGQRAEVALPEQSAQPAAQKTLMDAVREHFGFAQPEPPVAQQAPVPPPAAPAPKDEPPRPAQQGQTLWDAIAQGVFSLFVRLMPLVLLVMLLGNMNLLPSELVWDVVVALAITMAVIAILSKASQRAAEERAWAAQERARQQALLAQMAQPAAQTAAVSSALEDALPADDAAAFMLTPVVAPKPAPPDAWDSNVIPSLMARGMLLVVLAIPALIGLAGLVFEGRKPYVGVLWLLYLSVFVPPVCCLLTPDDALRALLRGHPWFWKLWLLWAVLATGVFLWAMIDPHAFRIFLSVFGGGTW